MCVHVCYVYVWGGENNQSHKHGKGRAEERVRDAHFRLLWKLSEPERWQVSGYGCPLRGTSMKGITAADHQILKCNGYYKRGTVSTASPEVTPRAAGNVSCAGLGEEARLVGQEALRWWWWWYDKEQLLPTAILLSQLVGCFQHLHQEGVNRCVSY